MAEARVVKNYINGKRVESLNKDFIEVINPATKEVMGNVPQSTKAELDEAAQDAQYTFEEWRNTDVNKRARIMFKYQQLLLENKQEIAELKKKENGYSDVESLGEVQRGIENVEYAAGAPSLMMGDSFSSIATDIEGTSYRYPV